MKLRKDWHKYEKNVQSFRSSNDCLLPYVGKYQNTSTAQQEDPGLFESPSQRRQSPCVVPSAMSNSQSRPIDVLNASHASSSSWVAKKNYARDSSLGSGVTTNLFPSTFRMSTQQTQSQRQRYTKFEGDGMSSEKVLPTSTMEHCAKLKGVSRESTGPFLLVGDRQTSNNSPRVRFEEARQNKGKENIQKITDDLRVKTPERQRAANTSFNTVVLRNDSVIEQTTHTGASSMTERRTRHGTKKGSFYKFPDTESSPSPSERKSRVRSASTRMADATENYSLTTLAIKLQQRVNNRRFYYRKLEHFQTANTPVDSDDSELDGVSSLETQSIRKSQGAPKQLDAMERQVLQVLAEEIQDLLASAKRLSADHSALEPHTTMETNEPDIQADHLQDALESNTEYKRECSSSSVGTSNGRHRGMSYMSCIQELRASWKEIQLHLKDFGEELIGIMLSLKPEYRQCYELVGAPIQGITLVNMIGKAIEEYGHPVKLMRIMHRIGAKHRYYGVEIEHYTVVRSAWQSILPQYISSPNPTYTVAAWEEFWDVVVELMESGSRNEEAMEWEAKRISLWTEKIKFVWPKLHRLQKDPENILENTFAQRLYGVARLKMPTHSESLKRLETHLKDVNRMFTAVSRVVDVLGNTKAIEQAMEELTREFKDWLTEDGLRSFRFHFIDTCECFLTEIPFVYPVADSPGAVSRDPALLIESSQREMNSFTNMDVFIRDSKDGDSQLWNPQIAAALGEFWDCLFSIVSRVLQAERIPLRHPYAPTTKEEKGITIIFTDIEGSTALWETNPTVMTEAVKRHHDLIRNCIGEFKAYEVKTVGDSFLIACKTPVIAMQVALGIQLELMRRPIAEGFKMLNTTQAGGVDVSHAWRSDSMRVRMGIHYSKDISPVYDSTHDHYDYYGPGMNAAARIESIAFGGEILVSFDYLAALYAEAEYHSSPCSPLVMDLFPTCTSEKGSPNSVGCRSFGSFATETESEICTLSDVCIWKEAGWHRLKGITEPLHLVSCVHRSLSARSFSHAVEPFDLDAAFRTHYSVDV